MSGLLQRIICVLSLIGCCLSTSGSLLAQEGGALAFPEATAQWVNSSPLTVAQLKGKGVFLWYYEESCPSCRRKWPMLLELSRRYAEQPIVFIAVNSGTSRGEVETYVQQNNISWPVIVDPTRQFEKASGLDEISLQNVHQAKLVLADGSVHNGDWDDVEGSIKEGLVGAEWKVSPKGLSPALKPAWTAVEFGNYAAVASTLTKSLKSGKPDVKASAEKLMKVVQPLIDTQVAEVKAAEEAGDKWKLYRAYAVLFEKFKGYELPEGAEKTYKDLAKDPAVKEEVAALKVYEQAASRYVGATGLNKKRAQALLEKLAKDKPGTEAAGKALALLNQGG